MSRKRRYWIRFYCGECPLCGRDKSYRERVHGRKPKSWRKRYIRLPDTVTYDHCDVR